MDILLQNIKLYAPTHSLQGKRVDLLINDGKIAEISSERLSGGDLKIDGSELSISVGWTDMRCALNEPGLEYKEDISSLCLAAANGGFTDVAVLPNTYPVVDTAQAIKYIKQQSNQTAVALHPIAAATKKTAGKELSEMIDLKAAGAIAFSDGMSEVTIDAVFARVLRYLQPLNSLFMVYPEDRDLLEGGQMHEGVSSTMLGMKGMPAIAEETALMKALILLEYYGGSIHFSTISTAQSVALIKEAKAKGLKVTCDIAAYQLAFTDNDLAEFDTYLKVKPPFRTVIDIDALLAGLKDGTIDVIVSNHCPQDTESKQLEFDLAEFGTVSLETAFAAINTFHKGILTTEAIIEKISVMPRKLLGLPISDIIAGTEAALTIFHETLEWDYKEAQMTGSAKNSPFINRQLKGKALGTINKGQIHLSDLLKENYLVK
ncbi:MAG: dihydroorotase [Bacteroidota bacterium]